MYLVGFFFHTFHWGKQNKITGFLLKEEAEYCISPASYWVTGTKPFHGNCEKEVRKQFSILLPCFGWHMKYKGFYPPSPPPPSPLADKEVRKHLSLSSLPLPYFSPVQGRYSCMISPLLGKCCCYLDLPSLICLNQIKGHALAKFFQVWIFHYFKPQQTELMRAK